MQLQSAKLLQRNRNLGFNRRFFFAGLVLFFVFSFSSSSFHLSFSASIDKRRFSFVFGVVFCPKLLLQD